MVRNRKKDFRKLACRLHVVLLFLGLPAYYRLFVVTVSSFRALDCSVVLAGNMHDSYRML